MLFKYFTKSVGTDDTSSTGWSFVYDMNCRLARLSSAIVTSWCTHSFSDEFSSLTAVPSRPWLCNVSTWLTMACVCRSNSWRKSVEERGWFWVDWLGWRGLLWIRESMISSSGSSSSGSKRNNGLSQRFRESGASNRITRASKTSWEYAPSLSDARLLFHCLAISNGVWQRMVHWVVLSCFDTQYNS